MMVVGTGGVCGPVCACLSGICTCCWRPEPRLAPSSLYLALDTPHLHCIWPPARAVTSNPCCSHSALRGTPCSHGKQNVRASFLSTCCISRVPALKGGLNAASSSSRWRVSADPAFGADSTYIYIYISHINRSGGHVECLLYTKVHSKHLAY